MIDSHAKRTSGGAKQKLVQATRRQDHHHSREKENNKQARRHQQVESTVHTFRNDSGQPNQPEICCCRICFHDELLIVEQREQQDQHSSHLCNPNKNNSIYSNPKIVIQHSSMLNLQSDQSKVQHHYEKCQQPSLAAGSLSSELESESRKPTRLEVSDKKSKQKLKNHIMKQQVRTLKSDNSIPTNVKMQRQNHQLEQQHFQPSNKNRHHKSTSREESSLSRLQLQDIDQNHLHKHEGLKDKKQECAKCQLIIDWTRAQANLANKIQKQQKQHQQYLVKSQSKEKLSSKTGDCSACLLSQANNKNNTSNLGSQKQRSDQQHTPTSALGIEIGRSHNNGNHNFISECEANLSDKDNDELGVELSLLTDSEPIGQTQVPRSQHELASSCTIQNKQQPKVLYTFNEQHIKQEQHSSSSSAARIIRRLPQRLSARLSRLVSRSTLNDQLESIDNSSEVASHKILKKSPKSRKAPEPPNLVKRPSDTSGSVKHRLCHASQTIEYSNAKDAVNSHEPRISKLDRLLNEQEVTNLEHALKSHKSSVYVAGCLANLYLTKTKLVDNGRKSSPENDDWQLKQTGVPILTFDSGLAKNRRKRQLKINLAQRESGFVLWSDTIDHLSNYHAHDASPTNFHVMYLTQDHRLMAGLSFDDATCASLFLAQIELVTADPRNISLTGPKAIQHQPHQFEHKKVATTGFAGNLHRSKIHITHNSSHNKSNYPLNGPSEPVRYTWSTLKRAIRRNHKSQQKIIASSMIHHNNQSQATINVSASQIDQEEAIYLNATRLFRLKPLPALAASGGDHHIDKATTLESNNRKKKKSPQTKRTIPRKCDISAPCLFQHVIQVSRDQLSNSPMLSQFIEVTKASGDIETTRTPSSVSLMTKTNSTDSRRIVTDKSPPKVWADDRPSSKGDQQSVGQFVDSSCVSGSASSGFISASSSAGCASSISSAASSSSAYSASSFISPATSECDERSDVSSSKQNNEQASQIPVVQEREHRVQVTRKPNPPLRMQQPPPPPPINNGNMVVHVGITGNDDSDFAGESKINAMIRELESYGSVETVSAKRRLMADIAGHFERTRELKSMLKRGQMKSIKTYHHRIVQKPIDTNKWNRGKQLDQGCGGSELDISRL